MSWLHFLDKCDGVEPPVPVTIFTVAGTWSPWDWGFQADVARALADGYRYRWQPVGYPASFGPINPPFPGAPSYEDSVAAGVSELLRLISVTPGPFVMVGYSQGAEVVGVVNAALVGGPRQSDCRGVVTFGDPTRQPWDRTVGGGKGSGISRFEIPKSPIPRITYALVGDMYCTIPDNDAGDDMHAVYIALTRMGDGKINGHVELIGQVLKILQNPLQGGAGVIEAVVRFIQFGATNAHAGYGKYVGHAADWIRQNTS